MTRIPAVIACAALLARGTALPEATLQERCAGDDPGGSASLGGADSDTRLSSGRVPVACG